jgi:23S rRNA pseudouridine1911/1915/1917 synthase
VSERIAFTAGEDDAGRRLDARLAEEPAIGSRAKAQRLIESGAVTVDGRARQKRHQLSPGEAVEALIEERPPADSRGGADVPFEVVYEDDDLMIVDKPAGVVVHPAPGHPEGTLAQALAARGAAGGDPLRPGIVHRLDRDTSGLLVVAKSEPVHRALQQMLRERGITREYLALVEGRPASRTGTIDAAVGRDRRERTLISTRTDAGRDAVTHFELLEALPRTSLLKVRLETGRTHQIRAHMAAIGHPVVGDPQYGGAASGRRLGLTRQFLHSATLMFEHPTRGENLRCESKLPVELRRAFDAAQREPVSEGPDGD